MSGDGADRASGDTPEAEGVRAPAWARLILTALPFVVIAIVLLVLRSLHG